MLAESGLDLYVVIPFVGYTLVVFGIAIVANRYLTKSNFETEYYVGGRSLGAWVLAFSWVATLASGGTFMGYPSNVYSFGWSMALWVSGSAVTAIIGLGIVGKRINRIARQTGALTLVDILRDRYNSNAVGIVYAVGIVMVTTVYLIAQFAAGARILESMFNIDYRVGLLIFAGTVVAYTTYGGFRAVAWTDTFQGVIMIVGIVALVPLAIMSVSALSEDTIRQRLPDSTTEVEITRIVESSGLERATLMMAQREDPSAVALGLETTRHAYIYGPGPIKPNKAVTTYYENPAENPKPLIDKDDPEPLMFLPMLAGISLFVLRSIGGMTMPTTVPRMLAFRDTKALRRSLYLLAPYFILMYGSSLITMNCAYALGVDLVPGKTDVAITGVAKAAAPAMLAGLLLAAPFAAVMSTVDSALLVVSGSVVRDLLQKTFKPNMSLKTMKRWIFFTTGFTGLLVFCIALIKEPKYLQPLIIHYTGASGSALFCPSIATLFWKRSTRVGVFSGLLGGLVVYGCAVLIDTQAAFQLHPFMFGIAGSALLTMVGSLLSPRQDEARLALYFGK